MKTWINGETVTLIVKTQGALDPFGNATSTEAEVSVDNVIVGEPSADDLTTNLSLNGKKIDYVLGIPKTDNHTWEDTCVIVRGRRCRTVGIPIEYTDGNLPGWWKWNKKVKVESYE